VLLSPCNRDQFDIFKLIQSVNPGLKPLSELDWHEREKVWETLTRQIMSDLAIGAEPPARTKPAHPPCTVSKPGRKKIPPLLHYHFDRKEQEAQIDEALRAEGSTGILFCVAHGDERECHDKFLEHLAREILPEILGQNRECPAAKEFHVDLPACDRSDEFRRRLLRYLGLAVLKKSTATRDELDSAFVTLGRPVVIQARLTTQEWTGERRAAVYQFLDFWDDWPERPAMFRPVVFLVVIYQRGTGRGLLGWYRRLSMRRANRRFREHINAITNRPARRARTLVLDELRGVEQSDLENWANDETIRRFSSERDLLAGVRALWKCPGLCDADQRIPMEIAARELKRLLDPENAHPGVPL
jgi:hypothetical protein